MKSILSKFGFDSFDFDAAKYAIIVIERIIVRSFRNSKKYKKEKMKSIPSKFDELCINIGERKVAR